MSEQTNLPEASRQLRLLGAVALPVALYVASAGPAVYLVERTKCGTLPLAAYWPLAHPLNEHSQPRGLLWRYVNVWRQAGRQAWWRAIAAPTTPRSPLWRWRRWWRLGP
jgi:hypothetical protein